MFLSDVERPLVADAMIFSCPTYPKNCTCDNVILNGALLSSSYLITNIKFNTREFNMVCVYSESYVRFIPALMNPLARAVAICPAPMNPIEAARAAILDPRIP